ncbi:MAG: hypothetical protein ABEJ74_05745 [Haloferacaceae archaeon]
MRTEVAGTSLLLAGIVLLAATLSVSAVLAPEVGAAGGDGSVARQTLVGSQGGGAGWHKYGSVYLLTGNNTTWREDSADSYFDVTRRDDGTVVAAFMHSGYQDCGPYEPPCTRTGYRVIDTAPQPHVVDEYSYPVRTAKNSEAHDAEPLPSGEMLLTDMEHERIMTVKDGEITWQWRASDFYEAPPDPTKTDWLHINDVDHIGGDRYLVSVRNANQLLIVERGRGVVEVINEDDDASDATCTGSGQLRDRDGDGEVRCGDPSLLNHQHNPQWLGDGAVLVADSDNDRIVELHRNETGEWVIAWTLDSAEEVDFNWPRDADRLANGNTLVTDTLNRRLVEVNESGAVNWSVRTDRVPYEADRLPEGESSPGRLYHPEIGSGTASQQDSASTGDDVPGLSLALVGLRAVYPSLPFWYGELQLALTLLSLVLVAAGVRFRWVAARE